MSSPGAGVPGTRGFGVTGRRRGGTCHIATRRIISTSFSAPKNAKADRTSDAAKAMVVHGWHRPKPWLPGVGERRHGGPCPPFDSIAAGTCAGQGHLDGMNFAWQEGYGAFSVSASNLGVVERYIANQERHHRKMTYEQELREFLRKHGIRFDRRYVFG